MALVLPSFRLHGIERLQTTLTRQAVDCQAGRIASRRCAELPSTPRIDPDNAVWWTRPALRRNSRFGILR
jgi:hypothetical protein